MNYSHDQRLNKLKTKTKILMRYLVFLKNRIYFFKEQVKLRISRQIIKLQSSVRRNQIQTKIKRILLINNILKRRQLAIETIKRKIRAAIRVRQFNEILEKEKNNYVLYFLDSTKHLKVEIKIKTSSKDITSFRFHYCKIRSIYVSYIPLRIMNPVPYLANFVVDGNVVIDSRYPTVYYGQEFFNKIDFSQLRKEENSFSDEDFETDSPKIENNKFFNLRNIEHFCKKVQEEVDSELNYVKGTNDRKPMKKSNSRNISLSNLKDKAEYENKKLKYIKSMSSLLSKVPTRSILKKSNRKILIDESGVNKTFNNFNCSTKKRHTSSLYRNKSSMGGPFTPKAELSYDYDFNSVEKNRFNVTHMKNKSFTNGNNLKRRVTFSLTPNLFD